MCDQRLISGLGLGSLQSQITLLIIIHWCEPRPRMKLQQLLEELTHH